MIDIKELRRLAEAATPGEWKPMYSARKSNPSEKDKFYSVSALSPAIPGWCDAKNIDIATVCKIYDGTDASNSAYIAAANPSAILSLLDKIDAQEKVIAELHTSIAGAVQHGEQGWQRYEAANKMCLNQQNEIAGLNEEIARLRKDAWQPIDTAPKDGSSILAFLPEAHERVDIISYEKNEFHGDAWVHARCVDGLNCGTPTHWMPLPFAPDTSTQEVG